MTTVSSFMSTLATLVSLVAFVGTSAMLMAASLGRVRERPSRLRRWPVNACGSGGCRSFSMSAEGAVVLLIGFHRLCTTSLGRRIDSSRADAQTNLEGIACAGL